MPYSRPREIGRDRVAGTGPHASARARTSSRSGRSALLVFPAIVAATMMLLGSAPAALAQDTRGPNANWPLADRFSNEALRNVVYSTSVAARFIGESDSLWYHWRDHKGATFYLVIPKSKTKKPLFDHRKMAESISAMGRKPYEPHNLPFTSVTFTEDGKSIRFVVDSVRLEWNLASETLRALGRQGQGSDSTAAGEGGRGGGGGGRQGGPPQGGRGADFRNFSPDSTLFVFAKEHNLYLVEVGKPDTIQLSTDGEQWYSFGNRDTTQVQQQQQRQQDDQDDQDDQQQRTQQSRSRDPRVRANVTWSPDSKAFYVSRSDSRKVENLYLVNSLAEPRPTLMTYKYAMPGEENVAQQELFVYRKGETAITKLPVEKWKDQRLMDIHWTTGSDVLRLVRRDRTQRRLELVEVNLASKAVKTLLTENVENAFLERQNVRYVEKGGDMIWWSERTGWAHYYLYDHNGNLKNPLTSGPWRAESVVAVDSVKRVAWIAGVGREEGENPYYRHLYRVNLNGTGFALLDAGNADHSTTMSDSRRYFVDNYSRVDMAPRAVLRDDRGQLVMPLETMDTTRLVQTGWTAPEPFIVKAADGVTDIYGNMWKPFDFDSTKKYPIIASVYPGPQTEQVSTTFSATASQQRLAQLGFIVVQIGNRGGSPRRSNAYHSYGYYNLRDYGLSDKKVGIEQLASRHSFIDIDRVGIFGHSGGGFMSAAALMLPPYNDFFKVAVSSAGNHDNNVYNQNWSEQHHGLREVLPKTSTDNDDGEYDPMAVKFDIKVPTNHELAKNLKGKLLLVHGDMDNNVHPAGTIRLVNALIKENKRFDFMVMPGKAHGFGDMQPYFTRMMYEYFAEHLLGDYYRKEADIRN